MADVKKLQIYAFTLPDFTGPHTPEMMELQVNPQELEFDMGVSYDTSSAGTENQQTGKMGTDTAVGGAYVMPNFQKYDKMILTINTVIDATGVLPMPSGYELTEGDAPSVAKYIEDLKKLSYNFVTDKHGPPFLKVVWGGVLPSADSNNEVPEGAFLCQLTGLNIKYSLFSASGNPVRAELTLKLEGREDPKKIASGESPDLSHFVDVQYGDNLPKLCKDIYGSQEFYMQIARINNLPSIYALEPGMKLRFPPLDKASR
jgi:hypothetical protein